jgi:beta-glucosidase-like glycosyl hydrolase
MKKRTVREDAAQMVMPRINGPQLADAGYRARIETLVRAGLGGFILFGGDIHETPRRLTALQELADTPLFIASDVERGLGQQLEGGTHFPSQRAVASAISRRSKKDLSLLDAMLDAVREETRAAGIHIVFSPVVDVNNNPNNPIICTRAFGDDPEIVEWFGSRYIKGLQRNSGGAGLDVLACAKHFPGHGDTEEDSHTVLPVIRADRARLNRVELPPFREAVKDGVGTIMVAHLLVPALDPSAPTTFSKKIITELLREGMGFEGLIVSDALDMGALAGQYPPGEIAVRAVEAGIDILLHPQDAMQTVDAVVEAVEQGRLTRQRISESVERIREAKTRLGLFDKERRNHGQIDYEKHRRLSAEIGRKAFRILQQNAKTVLPLRGDARIACFVMDDDNNRESAKAFIGEMRKRFSSISLNVCTPDAGVPVSLVRDSVAAADISVIAVYSRISASKGRSGISKELHDTAHEIIGASRAFKKTSLVISFDSPYILEQFKDAAITIAAYGRMDAIQTAAADLLAGSLTSQ